LFKLQNCNKFGQLILWKIIKVVATRCHILRQKCTKFDLGWGSAMAHAPRWRSSQRSPRPGFEGALLRLREGKEGRGEGRKGEGRKGKVASRLLGGMDAPSSPLNIQRKRPVGPLLHYNDYIANKNSNMDLELCLLRSACQIVQSHVIFT